MRESDRKLFEEVARDKFGMEVCFDDIEKDLSSLRERGPITCRHLERIADFEMITWAVSYQKEKYIRNFKKASPSGSPRSSP